MISTKHNACYFVYILTNIDHSQLAVGVTGALTDRLYEMERRSLDLPVNKVACTFLVYLEGFSDVRQAILREQRLKSLSRNKKRLLISQFNPEWKRLNKAIYEQELLGKI